MSLYNSKIAAIFNNCGILPFPPLHFLISVILLIEIQISNMHNIILNSKGVFAKLKTRWIDTPSSAFFFHGLFTDEKTKRILSRIDASRLIFQSTVSFQPAWMQKNKLVWGPTSDPLVFCTQEVKTSEIIGRTLNSEVFSGNFRGTAVNHLKSLCAISHGK